MHWRKLAVAQQLLTFFFCVINIYLSFLTKIFPLSLNLLFEIPTDLFYQFLVVGKFPLRVSDVPGPDRFQSHSLQIPHVVRCCNGAFLSSTLLVPPACANYLKWHYVARLNLPGRASVSARFDNNLINIKPQRLSRVLGEVAYSK